MAQRSLLVLPGLLVAGLVLAACTQPASTPTPSPEVMEKEDEATEGVKTVVLAEQNDSGQTGAATLTEEDGKVKVVLQLAGGEFDAPQPAHIHEGACPTPGAVAYPLTTVVDGASETILDVDMATLTTQMGETGLAINVHQSAEEVATYTACGDLQ